VGVGRGGADYLIIMERRLKCLEQLVRAANPYQHLFIMVEMVHLFTRVLQPWHITVEVQPHVRRAWDNGRRWCEMVYLRETVATTTQRSTNATAGTNLQVMSLDLRSVGGWCHDGPSVYNRCCSPAARLPR